jgi:hypothetical protein
VRRSALAMAKVLVYMHDSTISYIIRRSRAVSAPRGQRCAEFHTPWASEYSNRICPFPRPGSSRKDQETSPTPHHGLSSVGSVVGTGVVPNSTLDACCGVRSILQIDANTRVAHWLCVESVVVVDDSVSGLGGGREGGLVGQVASPTLIMIHFRPLPQLQTSLKPMNP